MDMNRKIEYHRGEVWYVDLNDTVAIKNMGRPAVIVSIDEMEELYGQVTVAYLTTNGSGESRWNVPIQSMRRKSWVRCNNIQVLETKYLRDYRVTLTDAEMETVEAGIRVALGLESQSQDVDYEVQVERDMYKRLYEAALSKLIDKKLETDTQTEPRIETKKQKQKPKREPEPEKIDVNSCTETDLKNIGLKPDVCVSIINGRPYSTVDDLRRVPGMTQIMFGIIKNRVVANQPGKVNINVATADEIEEVLGIGHITCQRIVQYRNKNGPYQKPEDIMVLKRISEKRMKQIAGLIQV